MSSGVDYHGWTHLPKEQGGTDPIGLPSSSGLPVAFATGGITSRNLNEMCAFSIISWAPEHDDVFGYDVVSGSTAKYITIPPGTYRTEAVVYWSTDFGGGTFPFISQYAWFPVDASENQLAGVMSGAAFDDEQQIIYGEQFTAAEMDHHAMASTHVFSWEEADTGEDRIGIGVGLYASGSTKDWGAALTITQLNTFKTVDQTIT